MYIRLLVAGGLLAGVMQAVSATAQQSSPHDANDRQCDTASPAPAGARGVQQPVGRRTRASALTDQIGWTTLEAAEARAPGATMPARAA